MEIDVNSAVAQFLEMARTCQAKKLTAAEVIRDMLQFYEDVRVAGADIEDEADMLLFQWGTGEHLLLSEPTDFRDADQNDFEFDDVESKYLDFTRQVFVVGEDDDFDDAAIQMSITLVYGPATGKEKSGNVWISSPDDFDEDLKKHAGTPLVAELINTRPTRVVATVDVCG